MRGAARVWPPLALALAVAFPYLPLGSRGEFILSIAAFAVTTAILALSWDILARTGQLSLAHAAFFGIGAYTYALAAGSGGPVRQVLALLLGGVVSAAASLGLGAVTLRLHGMYFAIATLAFTEVVRTVVNQVAFTGGPQGLLVPALLGGGTRNVYYLGLAVLLALVTTSLLIGRSRLGYAFTAIRQGELVARVLGVDATRAKLVAFAVSSFFAGLAGGLYAGKTFYITPPEAFNVSVSVTALVVPIFGGLYTTAGPVLAALLLRALEEGLKLGVGSGYLVGYGVILVFSILYLPRGLMGLLARRPAKPPAKTLRSESRG